MILATQTIQNKNWTMGIQKLSSVILVSIISSVAMLKIANMVKRLLF
jgi:hypothetical protein